MQNKIFIYKSINKQGQLFVQGVCVRREQRTDGTQKKSSEMLLVLWKMALQLSLGEEAEDSNENTHCTSCFQLR